jgi:hypothetical protein
MEPEGRERRHSIRGAGLGVLVALIGIGVFSSGVWTIGQWRHISAAYAACGSVTLVAGLAMIVAGFWAAISSGRESLPLWIGGGATVVYSLVTIIGTLTDVIPCASPS